MAKATSNLKLKVKAIVGIFSSEDEALNSVNKVLDLYDPAKYMFPKIDINKTEKGWKATVFIVSVSEAAKVALLAKKKEELMDLAKQEGIPLRGTSKVSIPVNQKFVQSYIDRMKREIEKEAEKKNPNLKHFSLYEHNKKLDFVFKNIDNLFADFEGARHWREEILASVGVPLQREVFRVKEKNKERLVNELLEISATVYSFAWDVTAIF